MVVPLTRMQTTPTIDMRENRDPTSRSPIPSRTPARASRKHGMPPIQIAAPSWCSPSTASNAPRLSRRAAAWVVKVAAASSIRPSASSGGTGARSRQPSSTKAMAAAAAVLTRPATANSAVNTWRSGSSMVSASTAACNATVATSDTSRATAAYPATRAVPVTIRGPARPSFGAKGWARNARNSTPPNAMDCDRIVSPCTTIDR